MSDFLSFKLTDDFIEPYTGLKPNWGFSIGGGNSLSELTFILKYSRKKDDGTKEQWWEVCRRCVEGMYSILKDHAKYNKTPWNDLKAQKSARDAYDRMFHFKWTPPGRGLQHMGTRYIAESRNGARLINCSAVSTEKISTHSAYEATLPFVRLMEMSMNGIGVGIDCRGAGNIVLHQPTDEEEVVVIDDTREAWAQSVGILLESFFFKNRKTVKFDYSRIRPEGAILHSFGGTASGPGPLMRMHEKIAELLSGREGEPLSSRDIMDIANLSGKAAVAGGSRRSALIGFGYQHDEDYVNLKNWNLPENAERTGPDGWAWASNNSIIATSDEDLSSVIEQIKINGEPGIIWTDIMSRYGRLNDPENDKDTKSNLSNPCFSADTLIAVADGRGAVPISELAESGDDVAVYAVDPDTGMVEIKMARHPRLTGKNKDMVKVTFNDGSSIRTTLDHKFLMKDGTTKLAKDLVKNDSVPAFTKRQEVVKKGGNKYWQVVCDTNDAHGKRAFEHRLIAEFFEPEKYESMYSEEKESGWIKGGLVIHHKDYNGLNNAPDNLEIMTFKDHASYHAKHDKAGEKNGMFGRVHSDDTKALIGAKTRERWQDEEYQKRMKQAITDGVTQFQRDSQSQVMKERFKEYYLEQQEKTDLKTIWRGETMFALKDCEECGVEFEVPWRARERAYCGLGCANKILARSEHRKERQREVFADAALVTRNRQIEIYLDLQTNLGSTPMKKDWEAACKAQGVLVRFQAKDKTVNPNIISGYKELKELASAYNHRVISVEFLEEKEDVYNLTVDDFHTIGIINSIHSNRMKGIFTFNCGEIQLESGELCNLSELYPTNHSDVEDLKKTIKHAYMYTKAVTLLPTPWAETNEVLIRNRRVGVSMTGVAQFVEIRSWSEIRSWMNEGYRYLVALDKKYSSWLGVRESIALSTIKPAGSTSLIAGVTPGVHWPTTGDYHIRRVRFLNTDPLLEILSAAGYLVEKDVNDPLMTAVVSFPTTGISMRSEREVSVWEKASLAALAQRYWSDNMVSCTLSFTEDEQDQLGPLFNSFQGQFKSASFLPIHDAGTTYEQAPYEPLSETAALEWQNRIINIPTELLYKTASEFEEEKFCSGDTCTI